MSQSENAQVTDEQAPKSENDVRDRMVAARDALDHALDHLNIIPTDRLIEVTQHLEEHPEDWEWPCACKECCSYG